MERKTLKWGYEELKKLLLGNDGFWTILQKESQLETNQQALKIRQRKLFSISQSLHIYSEVNQQCRQGQRKQKGRVLLNVCVTT